MFFFLTQRLLSNYFISFGFCNDGFEPGASNYYNGMKVISRQRLEIPSPAMLLAI
jgi:hypothetical protein